MSLLADDALGLIETRGLVGAIEAADAMLKASEVHLIRIELTVAALMTVEIGGETAAVLAAVDAGRAAAERVGQVVSSHVIPRPDSEVRAKFFDDVPEEPDPQPRPRPRRSPPAGRTVAVGAAQTDLGSMTVRDLRRLARQTPDLPIQGREIARANKELLVRVLSKAAK